MARYHVTVSCSWQFDVSAPNMDAAVDKAHELAHKSIDDANMPPFECSVYRLYRGTVRSQQKTVTHHPST